MRILGPTLLMAAILLVPTTAAQGFEYLPCAAASNTSQGDARVFCEPLDATHFIQFDHFLGGIAFLEEQWPDFIDVRSIGESVEGRSILFVEVTNENSPVPRDEKLQIGYSASIHANEPAGREGMLRVVEDLVRGIGPHGTELRPYLDDIIVNVWFPNPDSWATGDYFSSSGVAAAHECNRGPVPLIGGPSIGMCSGFDRENALGVDLNREFPNPGLIHKDHTPMSEPESQAVVRELRFSGNHSNLVAGVDLHGMINSANMIRSIIPNQDYDFRRMVLAVDMLRTTEDRVNNDPAFSEWSGMDALLDQAGIIVDEATAPAGCVQDPSGGFVGSGCLSASSDAHDKPMQWGARWDMIGYTDTGFTSDYLMLSPRSPTGGMGAVGTITEFAYSHVIPDNKYVAKLTDMHVAGVRQIVRTQMEMVGRLDTPVLAGTGPVGYAFTEALTVSSQNDPSPYEVGVQFDRNDPATWFDFDQVDYEVSNLNFWRDLDRFSSDDIRPVDVDSGAALNLDRFDHFVLTDTVHEHMTDRQLDEVLSWVESGGHLLVTDASLTVLADAGLVESSTALDVYLGHADVVDWDHPLMADVTWDARVTGEGPAIGIHVGGPYPNYVAAGLPEGAQIVGTTQGEASVGRIPHGDGSIDFFGAMLPQPRPVHGDNEDHRYGLADYSVSAFTYWLIMNSLGGEIAWEPLDRPFVPYYSYDPLYGDAAAGSSPGNDSQGTPGLAPVAIIAAIGAAVAVARVRRN